MALKPPPPPTKSEPGSFAWMDWYRSLYDFISSTGSIAWSQINFAGSKLTDITTRLHSNLQGILGTGSYHISSSEASNVTALPVASIIALNTVVSKAGYPTTSDIAAGSWAVYKDTTSGDIRVWTNDGGTMKSSPLATTGPVVW